MRPRFRVVNPVKGIAEDASGIYFYFARTLDLQAGDIISAEVIDHNLLIDVFVEEGPSAGKERSEFESAGGPERDAVAWNPHRGTPHRIAGTPDSGRFSHYGPEHAGFEERKP